MLTSYRKGKIQLDYKPKDVIDDTPVIVTFLDSGPVDLRQRGTKYHPGKNVRVGSDDTIYAVKDGTVKFQTKKAKKFNGRVRALTVVNVVS